MVGEAGNLAQTVERANSLLKKSGLGTMGGGGRSTRQGQPLFHIARRMPAERSEMCHRYAVHLHSTGMDHAVPWVGTHGYDYASPPGLLRRRGSVSFISNREREAG